MTVQELIDKLKQFPGNRRVGLEDPDGFYWHQIEIIDEGDLITITAE